MCFCICICIHQCLLNVRLVQNMLCMNEDGSQFKISGAGICNSMIYEFIQFDCVQRKMVISASSGCSYLQLHTDGQVDMHTLLHTHTYTCTQLHTDGQIGTHTPKQTHVRTHMHAHTQATSHRWANRYTHTNTHTHTHTHTHTLTHVHTHMYTHTHTHVHTHTQMQ